MSINPLKEFFKRRKAEVKFARAGPGQKLSTDSTSTPGPSNEQSSARQAAAEAAMKRFNKDNAKPAQRPRPVPRNPDQPTTSKRVDDEIPEPANSQPASPPKELLIIDGVPQRNVQIYSTEELAKRVKQPDIDDDFFRLTVEDAKLFKQRYDEERARNEILRTSEMRKREEEARRPTTNVARIRFKLPNNMILEASFSGSETLATVREWMLSTCEKSANLKLTNFDILFGLRPLRAGDFDKTVKQSGFIPATTLTIVNKGS